MAHRDAPLFDRWTAFFVNLKFDGPKPDMPMKSTYGDDWKSWPIGRDGIFAFTTTVSIVPNTFPYSECHAEECYGKLV